MKNTWFAATALLCFASSSFAQVTSTQQQQDSAPIVATVAAAQPGSQLTLPANTEVMLRMNEELTTRGGKVEVGHSFRLSVVEDVRIGNYVVIPRGTPAMGEVVWKTGKGAFGKSGKMEIELRSIDLNGRRIPVTGRYRQEGEGNTVATVAAVVAVGVFGAFVTGKSATIPQGRELKAYTAEALSVALPASPSAPVPVATPAVIATPAATH